ncbi:MAG TPA: 3-methyl-2-oxobutanoate hydroxymethyltransferase [Pyrinomonadaceae bacterium]|jgi:3-methyl-2-oxobutanoate hydroxymethyltransferase|nr:3-methyl-2-oxobutanoate hydroxymethyltransferase [Pyrinomonadaceae bacterium]
MVYLKQQRPEKVTVPAVRASKERGEKLVCLTAYDYPTARIVDEAGTDIILVGDSLGNVVLGYDSTVPVTLEEMLHHTRAVRRGVERALLVADMPYGAYHTGADDAVRSALRLVKEGGAEAVKLEGGRARAEVVRRLVSEEIPVMGHVGLTPQSLNKLGSYRLQAKTADAARALVEDALTLEEAGAFAVVLEVVPREIARAVTEALHIPTIGIGAGPDCDAQILVTHDLLGLSFSKTSPRFVRRYADLREAMGRAIQSYADDVRAGSFPADSESYPLPADAASELGMKKSEV